MAVGLFHITDIANLPSIVSRNGLACLNLLRTESAAYRSIAYETVQGHRDTTLVPCGPGGMLHDYVPFYWAPRSPMLYAIHRGAVPACTNGQKDIIYLVSSVEAVKDCGLPFVFTDGHGIMDVTNFYDDLQYLDKIDWPLMKERYWRDTNEDPDRKRRRQAEFLVRDFFPLSLVKGVAVMRQASIAVVREKFGDLGASMTIEAIPGWYY